MASAQTRSRRLCTQLLLWLHVHSLILLIVFLSVASKDLNDVKTTKHNTTTTPRPQSSSNSSAIETDVKSVQIRNNTSTSTVVNELQENLNAVRWQNFDILRANQSELEEYKYFLECTLANVSRMLNEDDRKSKRFIPLSSSDSSPDQNSTFVLSRQNETTKTETDNDIIVKPQIEMETVQIPVSPIEEEYTNATESAETDSSTESTATSVTEDIDSASEEPPSTTTTNSNIDVTETSSPSETKDTHDSSSSAKAFGVHSHTENNEQSRRRSFEPTVGQLSSIGGASMFQQNHTVEECKKLTQAELVSELKQKGTYNPDLMAYDVAGVFRFLDRSIVDQYERQVKSQKSNKQAVQRNVEALERILAELNLRCDVRSPDVISRLGNLTFAEPRRTISSPSLRMTDAEVRFKRHVLADDLLRSFDNSRRSDEVPGAPKRQKLIGDVHVVPFGCDKRGEEEDGYLRLCGACQAIRKLPETFFPPFINEVMCDEDKACLYFYDYPHGKCKQKHMNFVVLRNVGTQQCQVWQKFNLNVRVSCECFVGELECPHE
ncbi:hypothetical protein M3Y95_00057800 [Aphelenchoides besseyi]|nr:hypothetical protein M3Y95_00057800 [Aphelenchoides besseyi]